MRGLFRKRVHFVPQMEMAECGAACLSMVLDYHGSSVPLAETRETCGATRDGVNLATLARVGRAHGLQVDGVRVPIENLAELATPAILHWDFNHFVVLERASRRGVSIVDPALGRRRLSYDQVSRSFTGFALRLGPGPDLPLRPRRSPSLARYRTTLLRHRRSVAFVLGVALMLEIVGILFPAANQVLIDQVLLPKRDAWLIPVVLAVAIATLAQIALSTLRNRTVEVLHFGLDLDLMGTFVGHLMRLPALFFEQREVGDLMQRVRANAALRDLTSQMVMAFLDGLLVLSYGTLMVIYDPLLGSLSIALGLGHALLIQMVRRKTEQETAASLALQGREQTALVEALSVPEVVKAFQAERLMLERYTNRLHARINRDVEVARLTSGYGQAINLFNACRGATILWLGGIAVVEGEMTLGVFAGFLTLQTLLSTPMNTLANAFSGLISARAILARVDDVLAFPARPLGRHAPAELRGELCLDNVSFRYGAHSPWILQGLTLHVRPGERVALVGRSGQGKSTLAKLLTGLLVPTVGRVLVDGIPREEYDPEAIARHIGVVTQEPFLFDDTAAANIALRIPDATQGEIEHAARRAAIHDTLEQLPGGYRTRLSGRGGRLSGGERQRVTLARALLGRPAVLLLDEATSALDAVTEAAVQKHIEELGCTQVIVAHRMSTVRQADRILLIEQGRIVAQGSFEQLLRDQPSFAELVGGSSPGAGCTDHETAPGIRYQAVPLATEPFSTPGEASP